MIKADNFWRDDLDDRPVMVTIRCITYNHGKFIRQALESFVNQNTAFRYEAIIHDDCSTDNTAEIIKEYAQRYPSIIKPIFEEENLFSTKGLKVVREIMDTHVRGKYVALCEGDDYWTNPNKLQMQFDFMESHPEVALCFHNAHIVYEEVMSTHLVNTLPSNYMNTYDLSHSFIAPTASFFFRSEVLKSKIYQKAKTDNRFSFGDIVLMLTADTCGKVYSDSVVMSAYRKHSGGMTKTFTKNFDKLYYQYKALIDHFGPEVKKSIKPYFGNICVLSLIALKHGDIKKGINIGLRSLIYEPLSSVREIYKWAIKNQIKQFVRKRCSQ